MTTTMEASTRNFWNNRMICTRGFPIVLLCLAVIQSVHWFVNNILTCHMPIIPEAEQKQSSGNDSTLLLEDELFQEKKVPTQSPQSIIIHEQSISSNNSKNIIVNSNTINNNKNDTTIRYKCANNLYTKGNWVEIPTNRTYYHWVPSSPECILEPWSQDSFCTMLRNRSILIVGDSVNGNLFSSIQLEFSVPATTDMYQYVNNHSRPVQQHAMICNQKSALTYVRNDWLTIDRTIPDVITGDNVWTPWLHHLRTHQIVLLNKGAHARPVSNFNETLVALKAYLVQNYKGTVLFRTTPRGHVGCTVKDTKPITVDVVINNGTTDITTSTENNPTYQRFFNENQTLYQQYNYGLFPQYNTIMKQVAMSAKYRVIDIAPIYELRPDVHKPPRDCLHLLNKKKELKLWLQLFLNALKGNLD